MMQLLLWPSVPLALASRLAAVGCELIHDPQTSRYGYATEWRMEGHAGGTALFTSLEDVEEWLEPRKKRTEAADELVEVAA